MDVLVALAFPTEGLYFFFRVLGLMLLSVWAMCLFCMLTQITDNISCIREDNYYITSSNYIIYNVAIRMINTHGQ